MPTSTIAAIMREVATGRLMKGVEMLMDIRLPLSDQPPVLPDSAPGLVSWLTATWVPDCNRECPPVTTI